MRRAILIFWTGLLAIAFLLAVCMSVIPAVWVDHGRIGAEPMDNTSDLETSLQALGAQVERIGAVPQLYFNRDAQVLKVDGEVVQVFEFPDAASADQAARLISPDGQRIGDVQLPASGTPYFFKEQRLIVLYQGDNHPTLVMLATILGMPITQPSEPHRFPGLEEENA